MRSKRIHPTITRAIISAAFFAVNISIAWHYFFSEKKPENTEFQPSVIVEEPQDVNILPEEVYSLTQNTLQCTSLMFQGLIDGKKIPTNDPALTEKYVEVLKREGFLPSAEAYGTLESICQISEALVQGNEYVLTLKEDASLFYVTLNRAEKPYAVLGLRGHDSRLRELTDDYQWLRNDDIYLLDMTRDGRVDFFISQDTENGECTGIFLDKSLYAFYIVDPERANPKIITLSIPQEVYARTIDEVAVNALSYKNQCPKPEFY